MRLGGDKLNYFNKIKLILHNQLPRIGVFRLSTIGILNVSNIFANALTGILLARLLTKNVYGTLIAFYAGFGMIRLLTNLGLGVNVTRDIAQSKDDMLRAQVAVYSTGAVRIVSILIVLVAGLVLAQISRRADVLFSTLAAVLASGADFTFAILAGTRRMFPIGIMTVIQPVAYFALVSIALLIGVRHVEIFMILFASSFGLMMIAGLLLVLREKTLNQIKRQYFRLDYLKVAISFILVSYVATLLSQLFSSLSTGSLGWLGHYEEAAEFSVAFTIVSIPIAIIGPTLTSIFFPEASYQFQEKGKIAVFSYLNRISPWIFGLTLIFSTFLFFFADRLIMLVYGEKYLVSVQYFRILLLLPVATGIFPIFTLSLFVIDKAKKSLIGLGLQAVILFTAIFVNRTTLNSTSLSWYVVVAATIGVIVQFSNVYYVLRK